jgi:dolichol-phosphate mannosyltransferase
MTSWVGFKQTGVFYVRQERDWGETKYPFRKMLRFALDAITGFSFFPLQVTIYASLVLALFAVLAVPVVAFLRLSGSDLQFEGQATTLVVVLLMSSFQLFFFFIMGQYLARVYDEVRQRPLYIVADVWEGETSQDADAASDASISASEEVTSVAESA